MEQRANLKTPCLRQQCASEKEKARVKSFNFRDGWLSMLCICSDVVAAGIYIDKLL